MSQNRDMGHPAFSRVRHGVPAFALDWNTGHPSKSTCRSFDSLRSLRMTAFVERTYIYTTNLYLHKELIDPAL